MTSCNAFAKLIGVSRNAVSMAIKDGRLVKSVTRDEYGNPKIADVELAKREWAANTDVSMVRRAENVDAALARAGEQWEDVTVDPGPVEPDAEGMSPAQRKAHWEALTKELEFRAKAGELVKAADVEAEFVKTFTICKTRLLGIPSRAKQQIPTLTIEAVAILEQLIRDACEDLARSA